VTKKQQTKKEKKKGSKKQELNTIGSLIVLGVSVDIQDGVPKVVFCCWFYCHFSDLLVASFLSRGCRPRHTLHKKIHEKCNKM